MSLYDCRCNADSVIALAQPFAGAEPFPRFDGMCGVLFDAHGSVIGGEDQRLYACNTETGEVWRWACAEGVYQIDPETKRAVLLHEYHLAPLQYVPRPKVAN